MSGEDGHFLHARWVFTMSGTAVKACHLRAWPGVSVAHIVGDGLGIFCHGQVEFLSPRTTPDLPETEDHLVAHYGASPPAHLDIAYLRVQPHWMVSYAVAKDRLLAEAN